MKTNLFSVHDKVAGAFCRPFTSPNEFTAKRAFVTACSDPESELSKAPADYALYRIGLFDDETGMLSSELPCLVCHGVATSSETN